MMVRRPGCVYCAQWDREIGPVYGSHPEGRAAPLFMVDVEGPYPDGLALDRRPWLTPSFILLRGGQEVARFEGYPGAERFFEVLRVMLDEARRSA
jgi:thioredoxin-related protein